MCHQCELILCLTLVAISANEYFCATWGDWNHRLRDRHHRLRDWHPRLRDWQCKWIIRQAYIMVRLIVRDSEWLLMAIKIRHNIDKLHMGSPKSWSHIILWGLAIGWLWHLRWVDSRLRLLGGLRRLRFRGFLFALFNLDRHII